MARFFRRFGAGRHAALPRSHRSNPSAAGWVAATLLALCLTAQASGAQEVEEPRWIPSIQIGAETFAYGTNGSVDNSLDPPRHEGNQSDTSYQNLFRLGGQLLGPAFEGLPGRPRLFIQGGAGLKSFSSDKILKFGEPGTPEPTVEQFRRSLDRAINPPPRPPPAPPGESCLADPDSSPYCPTADAEEFDGQGSDIHAEFSNPSWYAALGVAFNLPVSHNLLFQIKPSLAYSGETIDMVGRITTVTEPAPDVFEIYRTFAKTSTTDHHLGAGIEFELVLLRNIRPVTTSLYTDIRLLWLLSDPTATFADPLGVGVYTVTRDTFMVRGGAGVRFSWMGFGGI